MSNGTLSRKAIEERAHRIEQYFNSHDKDKKRTYEHFMDEGISKKTIYNVIKKIEESGKVTFKKPTGRKVSVCTPEMFEKIANLFKNNPDLSCREAARKLGIARTTIFRIMAKMRESNIETYKVIESEPRCPTCHQKVDPKTLNTINKRKIKKMKAEKGADYDDSYDEYYDISESEGSLYTL